MLDGFVSSSVGVAMISEEDLMDIRRLSRQGYTYAEIGRLAGAFVQNKVSSLILGPPGVGKTHLAVELTM